MVNQPEPSQLLLHADREVSTGKTKALITSYTKLQELTTINWRQNPVFQAAPIGIIAYAITGRTLHSFLSLLVRGKILDLSTATLQSLQALFRDCHFLMINEKLRVIFPATSHRLFRDVNV